MHRHITRPALPALLLGWIALATPVRADVSDKAELFSADAVKKANKRIEEVKRKHKKDLVIETYKEVPEEIRDDYKKDKDNKDKKALHSLFDSWAVKRAGNLGVNGAYIFLCKEASWLQIEVDNKTKQHAFTEEDRSRLRKSMEPLLKEKDFDAVLAEAVDRVTTAYENHDKGGEGGGGGIGGGIGGYLCIGACILLGIWLVIGLMRAFSGGGGGGGGFFSGLLGGMFGAIAGMWMYDHFFGGGGGFGGSAMGGDGGGGDTGYSGDGGSYGDDGGGGGGDWGGGGGDFGGGGDWGGGGDF